MVIFLFYKFFLDPVTQPNYVREFKLTVIFLSFLTVAGGH